jgi:DNA-3-methyladenine glycosylase
VYLNRAFFADDPALVAQRLVGAVLEVTAADGRRCAGRLVEVEAYGGTDDPASHAGGGSTPRSAIMFGPCGVAYVYFIYGMHHCLNIVTGPPGTAGAVLLRALEPLRGRDDMALRRGLDPARCADRDLGAGPGRLCRALGIDLAWNGLPAAAGLRAGPGAPGRLRLLPVIDPPARVVALPRVGVRRAADRAWRFCDPDSGCLSRPAR